jgi:hypothetical protein
MPTNSVGYAREEAMLAPETRAGAVARAIGEAIL